MISAYANSRVLVLILSVLLLSSATFANFTPANAILNCAGFATTIIGTSGADIINGTDGDDVILGLEGNDIINGNGGNDVICSGSGSDVVTTGSGNDYLHGEGGADTFYAGDGDNRIDADFGIEGDVVITGSGIDDILLGTGSDNVDSGDGHDKITSGGGDDVIQTKGGDDKIYGGDGADTIDAGEGTNYIEGNQKNDIITSGSGNDKIYGGDGADTISAGGGINIIEGNQDIDIITSGSGNDKIYGGDGADTISAGDGINYIEGNQDIDIITSGSNNDKIYGGDGADTIDAGEGNNYIEGNQKNDIITSGSGNDKIYGGDGDDCINSGGGTDTIDGGPGVNSINLGDCIARTAISITDPVDGLVSVDGSEVTFTGTATSVKYGDLTSSIVWSSDLDGVIGSGASFALSTLSTGTHVITASVTDSDSKTGSISHKITINPVGIPSISITDPVDGLVSVDGSEVTFTGTATSVKYGDLTSSIVWSSDLDGVIGSGASFALSTLSTGTHVITASVTDSDSKTGSISHKITINPVGIPSISITDPVDGLVSVDGSEVTFTGTATSVKYGDLTSSIVWSSDLDGVIGSGASFALSTLSTGTHVITASVTDSDSKTNSASIIITMNIADDELVMICHLPPGNPTNRQALMIPSSDLQEHLDHGDITGQCSGNNEDNVIVQISKKQHEEMDKKNELKEKRNELKEIQNEIKQLKNNVNNDEDLKDTIKELITDIKETLQTLKSDYGYDKEYKEEIKDEFKDIKQKIYDDLTTPEKNSIAEVDSKISILSHSDDPKNDAKKMGLDFKNGKATLAIELADDDQKVLRQLSSISNIDVKNDNNVQITINLKDIPKLRAIHGIENIRPPFPAVQFEELVSEGVYFMNADLAQYAGITGKGIKVAVLDLSFTNNPKISDNIVEVKSFRQGVSVLPDHWDGNEALHGTAVAEIIADVAPDVELFLYSMESDIEFAAAVDEAISKNVDIIAMSAGWPNFPTDGTSPITKKIEEAVEHGIVFVVPAGNFGNKHWEGNFVDSNLNNWHDFSNTDEGLSITVTKDRIAEDKPIIAHLMWDVGLNDVADFDLVLVDPLGQIVDFSSNKQEKSSDNPFEYIYHLPETEGIYSLGVLYSGDMVSPSNRPHATLEIFTVNDDLEYPIVHSSVSVPADANGAIVVGAVNQLDGILEPYSSQGPTNNGKLAPDVVGPDGVTTLALDGKPFYGTSATTPYVAGLAALILGNNPDLSPEQVLTKIQQNTEPGLFSLQNKYDYATGYGTASAAFLVENWEVMK